MGQINFKVNIISPSCSQQCLYRYFCFDKYPIVVVEKPKLANHKHSYAPLYLVRRPTGQGLLISVCKHAVFFFTVYLQKGSINYCY